ncbi:DUF2059 domain-containing protein [Marinibactrum halimedae]|uniref:DUF2059 domain-containing protein n=1 Tax=Marinibactrum halimedae TaxID=1444977 RepID=A0AA37WNB2_9GAMM|nr:DUF2059 domain-containing protein [Marinibactrum halimedae]MCD9461242.1 DUF2059 domain-containing protein [Marinibactrum halimedae]GLS27230.1 hypothetical protein GCM10007877_29490 [Marinibactrum halimedae]
MSFKKLIREKEMKKLLISVALVFISNSVVADSREEKIQTLMDVQGIFKIFEEQLEVARVQSESVALQIMDQTAKNLQFNEKYKVRMELAFNAYMGKVTNPWSVAELVSVWMEHYGKHFTDEELDQLIVFYTSEIGKKDIAASQKALAEFTTHFQKLGTPIIENAYNEFITELKQAVIDCNCPRIQSSP